MAAQADTGTRGSVWSATTLIGPATVLVAAGLLVPLSILFRYSLNRYDPRLAMVDAVTPENYIRFFTDPFYINVFWTTLRVSALCTAVCLVMALPLAYMLARTQSRAKNVLIMLVCCRSSSATPSARPAG